MEKNRVSIVGLGYVGLPLALTIAKEKQYQVFGFDIDSKKIEKIQKGINPIKEDYIDKLIKNNQLKVSNNEEVIKGSEFIIICVPTPVKKTKLPDLTPLKSATKMVAKYLEKGQKIIIESTVNPGVCEEVILPILEKTGLKGGQDFELSHCPERINPGDKNWTIKNIPRNIGSLTKAGNKKVANFYRTFLDSDINEVSCLKSAEATKVIENTFRDINIAYVNELAKSFDLMKIDLIEVIQAASNKPFAFIPHYPGCGVGGHCIPVDPYYLIEKAKKSGFNHSFLKKARQINNSMPEYTIELLEQKIQEAKLTKKDSKVLLLGLAYKANIDDMRESPSVIIHSILKEKNFQVKIFDPYLIDRSDFKNIEEALKFANIVVLATAHKEFQKLSAKNFQENQIKIVIDGKNCLNKEDLISKKIIYKGIGR